MHTTFTIRGLFHQKEYDKKQNKWIHSHEWLTLKEGLTVEECASKGNVGLSNIADAEAAKYAFRRQNVTKWMVDWELQERKVKEVA